MMDLRLGFLILAIAATGPWAWAGGDEDGLAGWKVAYNVFHDEKQDDYEIFVMDADGGGSRNISNWKGVDWVYFAHGDRLFFLSDRQASHRKYHLYEMDAAGGNLRRITPFLLVDSWLSARKDGAELVVTSAKDGAGHEFYLIDRQGRELRRLTHNEAYENDPAFSPDGGQIVFRSKESGHDELWILDVESGERRQLTRYPEADKSLEGGHGYYAGPPRWEPNRNLISFTSKRDGAYHIYSVTPDGGGLRKLTPASHGAVYHAWSPDGRWLLFDGSLEEDNYDIFLMPGEGGPIRRLTSSPKYEQAPVFVRAAAP